MCEGTYAYAAFLTFTARLTDSADQNFQGAYMSSVKGPGDRIETSCTRCNDVTGHIIVALVGGKVVKVECCACGSVHKYHPPRQEALVGTNTVRRAPTSIPSGRGSSRAAQGSTATEKAWRAALERPSAPQARPYAMDMTLSKGDIVDHPAFGLGSVHTTIRPDKAEILFRGGMRTLRCCC